MSSYPARTRPRDAPPHPEWGSGGRGFKSRRPDYVSLDSTVTCRIGVFACKGRGDPDIQRLLWIPGVGKIVAFTLYLEIDGIERFPSVRQFFSYCRVVPGAKNSAGKTRHVRRKDGNRYLKLALSHAAVRAVQYFPEIKSFYQRKARQKNPAIARTLVQKELARSVYIVLKEQVDFNHTRTALHWSPAPTRGSARNGI